MEKKQKVCLFRAAGGKKKVLKHFVVIYFQKYLFNVKRRGQMTHY